MDDLRDPREFSNDIGEEDYGALTDDEPELSIEERRILEQAEAIKRKIQQRKLGYEGITTSKTYVEPRPKRSEAVDHKDKTIQIPRSPSPIRKKTPPNESIEQGIRKDFNSDLSDRFNSSASAAASSSLSTTTSYFINQLEQSRLKSTQEAFKHKKIMSQRTYTFDHRLKESEVLEVDELDLISGQQLSRRYIKHENLLEMLKDIKILRLNKLFAKVSPPNFQEPQYPNWCVIGIICDKSKPLLSNVSRGKSERYVNIKLTDFKYDVDITIWGSQIIAQYNKLRFGDIIAVLNPNVFVKLSSGTNNGGLQTFGLSLRFGDSILEIGQCKHFGYCKSKVHSTGMQCKNFINTSKVQFCSYHNEAQLNKVAGSRMEFQGSFRTNAHVKNGIKQSMYLGKPDKSSKVKVEFVNDRSAPKMDYVSRQRSAFSSDKAHKAFFQDHYEDTETTKEINKYEKDKQQKRKEFELRKKLSENFKEGVKLRKLQPIEDLEEDPSSKAKVELLKTAFTSEQLSNIGFDPSSKSNERGLLSLGRSNKDSLVKEFRQFTKKKKVDLTLDGEEIKKRKKMREENDEMVKKLRKMRYSKYKELPPIEKSNKASIRNTQETTYKGVSDSSDEEIDIEDKSFTNFKKLAKQD